MLTIVLASHNSHKTDEFRRMLSSCQILTPDDIGYHEPPAAETGKSYSENAQLKAEPVRDFLRERNRRYIVVAEDSGLEIKILGKAPGIKSARFCGTNSTDRDRRIAILEAMEGAEDRSAIFKCRLVVYLPDRKDPFFFRGNAHGQITTEELGDSDFGYDNIFFSDELQKTFGEATEAEKDSASHRGKAIRSMLKKLTELNCDDNSSNAATA